MNLVEVARSGKRFHRKGVNGWFGPITEKVLREDGETRIEHLMLAGISLAGFVADDWEIEEPKIEITREQFFKASEQARSVFTIIGSGKDIEHFTRLFAEHLGFKS